MGLRTANPAFCTAVGTTVAMRSSPTQSVVRGGVDERGRWRLYCIVKNVRLSIPGSGQIWSLLTKRRGYFMCTGLSRDLD